MRSTMTTLHPVHHGGAEVLLELQEATSDMTWSHFRATTNVLQTHAGR